MNTISMEGLLNKTEQPARLPSQSKVSDTVTNEETIMIHVCGEKKKW